MFFYRKNTIFFITAMLEISIALFFFVCHSYEREVINAIGLEPNSFFIERREFLIYSLYSLPVLSIFFILYIYIKNRDRTMFSNQPQFSLYSLSSNKTLLKWIFFRLSLCCLSLAIANPKYGTLKRNVQLSGNDIIIAIDVSKSMNVIDDNSKLDRLSRTKLSLQNLLNTLKGDKIGVIVFAGSALVQLPITIDYVAAKNFIKAINTNTVPNPGTSISSAIAEAIQAFPDDIHSKKHLVIVTDGENHDEEALEWTQKATKKNITVNTIGIGSVKGKPIPIYDSYGKNIGFKKDRAGNVVVSKLNEKLLKAIASEGNGTYIHTQKNNIGLEYIIKHNVENINEEQVEYAEYAHQYQNFLFLAVVFFMISLSIFEEKNAMYTSLLSIFANTKFK